MKKFTAFALAFVMMLTLVSCIKEENGMIVSLPYDQKEDGSLIDLESYSNVDYDRVYTAFVEEHILKEAPMRNGDIRQGQKLEYIPEEATVCWFTDDLDGDGVTELIVIEEKATDYLKKGYSVDLCSAISISVYNTTDEIIYKRDEVIIDGLLPKFSFVDITRVDNNIYVSAIGSRLDAEPFNDHYRISLAGSYLLREDMSSAYFNTMGEYDDMSQQEKVQVEVQLDITRGEGFGYTQPDDLVGKEIAGAERLALYSLSGRDGENVGYFDSSLNLDKGFYRFQK